MPQTQVNLAPIPGTPGLLLTNNRHGQFVRSVPAGVIVPFGVLCEIYAAANGEAVCRPIQDATVGGAFAPAVAGISIYDDCAVEAGYLAYSVPPSLVGSSTPGYPVGATVPLLYQGSIWGAWDGNVTVPLSISGPIQVWHSSTGAGLQGVFTTKPAQTTVGAEIDGAGSAIIQWDPHLKGGAYTDSWGNASSIIALNINLPGKS